ncbi:MAG: HIT domain-containing protein [Patescibacteria group bacterium]|jgi:diadenosine tetraphosphate (Ap4A) HIT family hydrolase
MADDDNRFINLSAVRLEEQRVVMEEIKKEGHCPFCRENLDKYHKAPIIKEGKFWILTENQWPYEKIKHQLLAIYQTHVEHLKDVDPEAGRELFEMFAEESRKRNMSGGGVAIRFGSSEYGNYGSSVLHIHAHLIEPDLEQLGESEAWKFKFGQPKNYKKQ